MSDAFSDLWNSTGASKPVEPPRKLGSIASASSAQPTRKPQNDVFSMLAAASSSSTVTSRSVTPAQSSAFGSTVTAKPMQKAASTGTALGKGDAFSDLLSGFTGAQSSNNTNLTMAQRAALAEQERKQRAQQQTSNTPAHTASSAWAGLDALGAGSTTTHTSSASHDPLDDLGFGAFSSGTSAPPRATKPAHTGDDWGLEDFISQPAPALAPTGKSASSSKIDDLLAFDDFTGPSGSHHSPSPAPQRSITPGEFDFGNREDRLLDNQSSDEDDILGDLSKPVEKLAARQSSARNTPSPQPPHSGQRSRAVSPPPHVLGQIVEMGFSIQQARVALAATDTGLDVQAALDMLLSNDLHANQATSVTTVLMRKRDHYRRANSSVPPTRSPPQTQRPARDRPAREGPLSAEAQKNLQEQADKLLAQASEIGLNMFNRANAFWKEGKERVQRAYEERAATAGSSRQTTAPGVGRGGRPKWMQGAAEDEHRPDTTHTGSFRDDEEEVPSPPRRQQAKQPPPRAPEQPPAESPASRLKVGNLFSDDPPAVYVSPFRRKGTSRTQTAENTPAASPAPPAQRATPSPAPARAPSPIPLVQRRTVSASPSAIAESAKHKAAGTEKFKLGQYAEAESLYSAAIRALPESHLLLARSRTARR
ncbi:hypothetical protein ONZ51_g13140 [Trametes cubensis]|uniref:UBA domain-containing protein n=1 Tax=Trametes cubensis TaxID=1111947 RepID=A0AAD7X684_9APHY|nr:hypothetical protein ONZ51_g13140 [Trametes cubensis]